MKRRWPREVVHVEQGHSGWLEDRPHAERKKILHRWISKEKRRTHKRERREGNTHESD